ncbi:MAG: MBL fold metallo-hydrolase [Dehalococcoidia bacterium]|nr:MBL fold metallo-hydrolase [Dehalococcoidia bacterium]
MRIKLTFFGATKSVTGSRFLIEANGLKFLVDCGLYQERDLRVRNWERFPIPPGHIDAILLTHAHIDHCGFIPRFVKQGFSNRIYCTEATADITRIMLLDSARLQEQDADQKKKRHARERRRGPYPEIPLYTEADAVSCFPLFEPVPYRKTVELGEGVSLTLYDAGHVLGSAMIEVRVRQKNEERILLFSGDIGRTERPILRDPTRFEVADYVLTESTYADRVLPDPDHMLEDFIGVIKGTLEAGGNIVIPSFALERAQDILYYLSKARDAGLLPPVQVYLDSPMAVSITEIFEKHVNLFDEEMKRLIRQRKSPFDFPGLRFVSDAEESQKISRSDAPAIIIAGSGMCTGGRIKYHLAANITRPESTILFVGYQAEGTLGRVITDGAGVVRILGEQYPVKAQVVQMSGFSSHADGVQLHRWLFNLKNPPRHLFVVHGEEHAANHLAETVRNEKGWQVTVPDYLQEFELD